MANERNWAVVEPDGTIQTVIYWDGVAEWPVPENTVMVEVPQGVQGERGGHYDFDTDTWTRAPEVEAPPEEINFGDEEGLAAVIEALKTVPEISQALAQNGISVILDEKGNPIGIEQTKIASPTVDEVVP